MTFFMLAMLLLLVTNNKKKKKNRNIFSKLFVRFVDDRFLLCSDKYNTIII